LVGQVRGDMQAKVKANGASQTLVVTANRLRDGSVVWLAGRGDWTRRVEEAAVFAGAQVVAAALAEAEAAERRQIVVDPYAVEVVLTEAGPRPLRMRERLRVAGPSVVPPGTAMPAAE
jgi:hypothetical protein